MNLLLSIKQNYRCKVMVKKSNSQNFLGMENGAKQSAAFKKSVDFDKPI